MPWMVSVFFQDSLVLNSRPSSCFSLLSAELSHVFFYKRQGGASKREGDMTTQAEAEC